jgi:glycosyltransferase involved in cell wall biosynthesis
VRSLLLVRNGVEHDARVLRAARVAERELGGKTLVVGMATASCPPGTAIVEGIGVIRLAAQPPVFARMRRLARPPGVEQLRQLMGRHRANPASRHKVERDATRTQPSVPRLTPASRARRILSGVSFALQALGLARKVRPSLVHANDWNTMWGAIAVKLICRSHLVYDSHELWADRNGRWEWRPWLLASEALFVRMADEIVTASPGYADVLAARHRIPRPRIVRNIPEHDFADVGAPSDGQPQSGGTLPHPHRIVYIGGLMPGRGLEQMIDALILLPQVRLRAVGPGAQWYRLSLLRRAASAGVEGRIELCAPVAPADVPQALSDATAGLCMIQPICRSYELCLPNKLFEYAAAGVPVLASDVPVIAALVRKEGLGEVVPAYHPDAVATSLERLLVPGGWQLAAERSRAFAHAHDWPGEASKLAEAYASRRIAS